MLTVAVLGPVELRRDGARLPLPSGKTTEVLVRLALDARRPVRPDRLIEDLWAADAVATGRNTLQSKVSQLRRALGDPGLIASAGGGYTLDIDPRCVDALSVVELAAAASSFRRSGDAASALGAATEGLSLFRGEALVDGGDGEWLAAHRVRLEEVRIGLLEDQFAARVELGATGDVIAELEGLVARYPLREGLWSSLITALYRAGRQADALAAYSRVRASLMDELGIEPGPGLRDLERQILRHSSVLDAPAACTQSTVLAASPGNLPSMTTRLVGRADELTTLSELLRRERLVTLVGPAGVGKTRLAVELARGLAAPGGVWLVRLDRADAATSIPQAIAETMQVAGGEQMLAQRLSGARTVLVLDSCEHVVDAVAEVSGRLLDAAAEVQVLATSQLRLGVDGESVHTLEPLALPDSIELFTGRAVEARAQFVLDDATAAAVEEVCICLDGLPLAIELAAARVRSLSVQQIARRLDDRFALLQDPTSRRPERRRALAGAIAWSYDLLFPDDQRGLWALACFTGGAPLVAAEHVLGALGVPSASAVDVVARLVDRSLVSVEIDDMRGARYRLLDSIRAFARDRLRDSGLADDAFAVHAAWFAEAADRCAATVRGKAQSECLAFVRDERANIDAALAWAAEHDPQLGVGLANGFGWTWVVLGDGVAGAARVRAALTAAGPGTPARDLATGLLLAGWLEASAGNVERAQLDLDGALELAEQLDDDRLRADAQRHFAFLRIQQGRPIDVMAMADASLAVYRPLGLSWEIAASLLLGAFASIILGDTAAATRAADEAVRLLAPIDDSWGSVHAEGILGAVARAEHRFDDAAGSFARAASESERLGFLGQAALHLANLGRVQQLAGDHTAAVDTLDRAVQLAGRSGDLRLAATARIYLARVLRGFGSRDEAMALLAEADRWYEASGGGDGALLARCLLASMTSGADRTGIATTMEQVRSDAERSQDGEVLVLASDSLALLAAERGDVDTARVLMKSADAHAAGMLHAVYDIDRVDAHRARALIESNAATLPVASGP